MLHVLAVMSRGSKIFYTSVETPHAETQFTSLFTRICRTSKFMTLMCRKVSSKRVYDYAKSCTGGPTVFRHSLLLSERSALGWHVY